MTDITADECRTAAKNIIRETFEKLGAAIGVQMQMPDAMIANLGVSLQAQIDLLAELQSTGRLIPAGGHVLTAEEWANRITLADKQVAVSEAWEQGFEYGSGHKYGAEDDGVRLTAEQVEDVEALVATANPYSAPAVRLRALFPAAEPAEEPREIGWFRTMTPEFATKHFGFPGVIGSKGFWTHTASDGGKWAWDGDDWELREYPPAPAEPAEEETKAEEWPVHDSWCTGTHGRAGNCIDTSRWIDPPIATAETHMEKMVRKGSIAKFLERTLVAGDGWHLPTGWDPGVLAGAIVYGVPASSPVVPAPTETEAGHA